MRITRHPQVRAGALHARSVMGGGRGQGPRTRFTARRRRSVGRPQAALCQASPPLAAHARPRAAPQMVGQGLWCAAHCAWTGSSVVLAASAALMAHHLFGCWHGDRRLKVGRGTRHPPRLATAFLGAAWVVGLECPGRWRPLPLAQEPLRRWQPLAA
jgi:hypothetical protein